MGLAAKPHSDLVPISLIVILPSTATHTIRSLLLLVRGGSAVVAAQFEIHGERRVGAGCGGGSPHGKGKGASASSARAPLLASSAAATPSLPPADGRHSLPDRAPTAVRSLPCPRTDARRLLPRPPPAIARSPAHTPASSAGRAPWGLQPRHHLWRPCTATGAAARCEGAGDVGGYGVC